MLGSIEVRVGEDPVAIPGLKPRAVLTVLGLYGGEVVSTETLVAVLWGDEPPSSARRSIQTHVAVLRRALGAGAVRSRPGGWTVVADVIDAVEFRATVRAGRQAGRDGTPDRAAAHFRSALDWWRGAPQLPATAPGEAEVTRWIEDQRAVAEEWADAALDCGRAGELVGRLEAAVAEAPLREHRWSQLMLALYRTGRQGEALRAFQRARRLLADELGVEPGPELQALEAQLLAQDPVLDALEPRVVAARAEAVPLPARLGHTPAAGFVGRRHELDHLQQMAKESMAQHRRRVVLVGGEPGIGKTALMAEFARTAHHDGATVLYGSCDEDLAVPYKPWTEALTQLVSHPAESDQDAMAAGAGSLIHLIPSLAVTAGSPPQPATSDGEAARYLLFRAVGSTLRAASQTDPLILCLDDLQWADQASLQLLRHLAAADDPARLLIVASYRDSEVAWPQGLADVLAALRREPTAERMTLSGLDETDLLTLTERVAGGHLGSDGELLRDSLLAETDGNPFFVLELLHHLADMGNIGPDASPESATNLEWSRRTTLLPLGLRDHGLPVGLTEVIGQRVARLGPAAANLLKMASVIGREFDLEVLSSVSNTDIETVIEAMDSAGAANLVDNFHGKQFSFVHALIEHTLYESLSPARRGHLHGKVGEALESTPATARARPVELAHHFGLASGPGTSEKAVRYASLAGDAALDQLAPDQARRWYTQALDRLDEIAEANQRRRGALLVHLGEAQRQAGDPDFRQTLLAAAHLAQELGSTDLLVAAALANDRGWMSAIGAVDTERVAVLEAAASTLTGTESAARARIQALLATELLFSGDFDRQRRLADEALAIARRCGPAEVAFTASRVSVAIASPETLAERLALTAEAEEAARQAADPVLQFWSTIYQSTVLCQSGDMEDAQAHLHASRAMAERLGQPLMLWAQTFREGLSAMLTGDLLAAEELAVQALTIGTEAGQVDAPIVFGTQIGPIRSMQGRGAEIVDLALQAATQNPGLPGISSFLAHLYVDLDRREDARRVLEPMVVDRFWSVINERRGGSLITMAYAAYAAAGVGWTEAAELLFQALLPFADQMPVAVAAVTGCQISYYLALLARATGRELEAERFFAHADLAHRRIGSEWGLAMSQLGWAEFLLERGNREDGERAADMLKAALDRGRHRGYQLIVRRAEQALNGEP